MYHVTEYSPAKTGEYPKIFPNFQNLACYEIYLKKTIIVSIWWKNTCLDICTSLDIICSAAWLAQLVGHQSAVREVDGSSPRPDQHSGS